MALVVGHSQVKYLHNYVSDNIMTLAYPGSIADKYREGNIRVTLSYTTQARLQPVSLSAHISHKPFRLSVHIQHKPARQSLYS